MAVNPFKPNPQSPSFPSLYNPRDELFSVRRLNATQPRGIYLTDPGDVFMFTFYWTLILYSPAFALCGLYAFLNITFPPRKHQQSKHSKRKHNRSTLDVWGGQVGIPLSPLTPRPNAYEPGHNYQTLRSDVGVVVPLLQPVQETFRPPRKSKERRSRLTFALIVLILFFVTGLLGALISSALIGFVLVGLYKAGGFYMSTWVPFAWAALHTFIGLLNLWPSVIAWI